MTPAALDQLQGKVLRNENLAPYVAFRIGGPADYFVLPANQSDIERCAEIAKESNLALTVLGSGTNLLIRDGGIRGIVLFLGAGLPGGIETLWENAQEIEIRVPAHFPKAHLLEKSAQESWSGLEFSAGIPGTLGGAVWMNAGTKWGSYSEVIQRVKLYRIGQGFEERSVEEMAFKYRGHGEGLLDENTVIVSVDLRLKKLSSSAPIYKLIDEILSYRGLKQPLEFPNCGSVFKNPPKELSERGAGRLIEASGLKGKQIGQAMFSPKHANFILNLGGARSSDVEELMALAQQKVMADWSVALEPEVIFIGENSAS